ncbi:MAG: rhomboid family intramembrane serine protease [Desulfurococcaceae archaeon]
MVFVPYGAEALGRRPYVTWALIAANVAVYVMTSYNSFLLQTDQWAIERFGYVPGIQDPLQLAFRALASMFVHADILHIAFNMYFLYVFGRAVEGFLGRAKYAALYFLSGLAAIAFYTGTVPLAGYYSLLVPAVGASGAISGVLGAYFLLFSRSRLSICGLILLFPLCVALPAWAFLLLWFAEQVLYGLMRLGGVAYFAHVGGFVLGLAVAFFAERRREGEYRAGGLEELIRELQGLGHRPAVQSLSGAAKAALVALLALSLVAAAYSMAQVVAHGDVYYLSVDVGGSSDVVTLAVRDHSVDVYRDSPADYVRILLNRLPNSFFYNASACGASLELDGTYDVIVGGLSVPVTLRAHAEYYPSCAIEFAQGTMSSRVVTLTQYGYSYGQWFTVNFSMRSTMFTGWWFLGATALVSTALSAISIACVAAYRPRRFEELPRTPIGYTYM